MSKYLFWGEYVQKEIDRIFEKAPQTGEEGFIVAAARGDMQTISTLLLNGIDANCHDSEALLWAAFNGHESVVSHLLDAGADARSNNSCRFRKLHPFDSRSLANQNMIAGCSLLSFFSSACCATVSNHDDGLKPKSWCCGINSTSCSSARHIGYV